MKNKRGQDEVLTYIAIFTIGALLFFLTVSVIFYNGIIYAKEGVDSAKQTGILKTFNISFIQLLFNNNLWLWALVSILAIVLLAKYFLRKPIKKRKKKRK